MASSTITKQLLCVLCNGKKNTGVFTCIGCSQTFCMPHTKEHKQILAQHLDKLILDHDQLQQSTEPRNDQSMTVIDEWERESIVKIRQLADDTRREFMKRMEKYTNQYSKRLKQLSEELRKAQNDNDFMEADLKHWSNRLDRLKFFLISPPTITIQNDNFIARLSVCTTPEDIFEMLVGDLRIEDKGQLVVHGPSVSHAVVRGSGEYSSGEHRFRFKIDSYNVNKWIFFGVISDKVTMRSHTWAIPSVYGWGGQDSAILNCATYAGLNGYLCDFELNDIIELLLDCDHQIIYLTNQRTKRTHRMNIDLAKCPFPWHFHLNLYYPNDRVRILCTDT